MIGSIQKEYVLYAYPGKERIIDFIAVCYPYQEFYMWIEGERPHQKYYDICLN